MQRGHLFPRRAIQARWQTRAFLLAASALAFFAVSTRAQSAPPQSYRLAGLHFTGLSQITEEQVVSATGLHIGDTVTAPQISDVQFRLAGSGVFESVVYRYTTHGDELTAYFELKESQNALPFVFDNFVWLSRDELDRELRQRVPLYSAHAPIRGTTLQEIIDALVALLHSKGVDGTVSEIAFSPRLGAMPNALLFQITGVSMPVRSVNFPGASGLSEGQLTAASAEILGRDYSLSHWSDHASYRLVPLYRRNGYLKVSFGEPVGKIIGSANDGSPVEVAVTLPVEEGLQYFWLKAEWAGNQKLPSSELDHLLGMKAKEVANQDKIDEGIAAIQRAYLSRGYIEANLGPKASTNDAERLVSYDFLIDEGAQYRMGQVHFSGLPLAAAQDLTKNWKLKPGDIFDAVFVDDYIKQAGLKQLFEMGIKKNSVTSKRQLDKEKAIVDLYIEFR
jgi:outer membrane protein insertion porin family